MNDMSEGLHVGTLQAFRARADRIFLATLAVLWLVCFVYGLFSDTWGIALGVGALATLTPLFLYRLCPGGILPRMAVAIAFMIFSALMIQQAQGQIEAHFGIFVLLAFLVLYCDWRPLILAAGVIAVHHLLFCYLQGAAYPVYVFPAADHGYLRVLVHAAFVVVETGVLCYIATVLRKMVEDSMEVSSFAREAAAGRINYALADTSDSPLLQNVASMQQTLHRTLEEVMHTAMDLKQLSARMHQAAAEIAQGTQAQQESTTAMASAVEELSVSASHITDSVDNAHVLAEESRRAASSGSAVIKRAANEMAAIAEVIRQVLVRVEELGEKSEKASVAVNIIKEIADQTNLLALNAAIEAARAGELGRGFAVVADEVRKLAERTTEATNEIAVMMSDMRNTKESMLGSIDEAVNKVTSGAEHAEAAGAAIDDITQRVLQVGGVVEQISEALREQGAATQEIARHVEQVVNMTDRNSVATNEIAAESRDLDRSAVQLTQALSRFTL